MRFRWLAALCSGVTVALLVARAPAAAPEVVTLDAAGARAAVQQGEVLIDVRRPDEWRATGVAPDSLRITAFDSAGQPVPGFVDAVRARVAPDQPVVLICRSGNRSAAAARLLIEQGGYRQVSNAAGGMSAWLAAGLPVTPCPTC